MADACSRFARDEKSPARHGPGESFQTRSADDAVFVLGDALATEKLSALRAARDGFPEFMVQTALVRERGHKLSNDE